ncbi:MAG: hypothetical protein KME31_29555 [Tolypothrix carrinoi HA7290-LM1]|nr:hypothetical protein [Tolypothrix carrinoi HA7290-LM1]
MNHQVNVVVATHLKKLLNVAIALFMATRNYKKSLVTMTFVLAVLVAAFKKCCRNSGRYDGSLRSYYF